MTRIGLLTTLWKRPAIEQVVLPYYSALELEGVELVRVAAGSEGRRSKKLATDAGWNYVEAPNSPLTGKHQAGLEALRSAGVDAVIVIGSDDLLGGRYWSAVVGHVRGGAEAYTVRGLYLYDVPSASLAYAPKARPGAGRMYSRRLLQRTNWTLWPGAQDRGLDRLAHQAAIVRAAPYERTWDAEAEGIVVLDIKSGRNLTSYEKTMQATHGTRPVDPSFLDLHFPGLRARLHPEPLTT